MRKGSAVEESLSDTWAHARSRRGGEKGMVPSAMQLLMSVRHRILLCMLCFPGRLVFFFFLVYFMSICFGGY